MHIYYVALFVRSNFVTVFVFSGVRLCVFGGMVDWWCVLVVNFYQNTPANHTAYMLHICRLHCIFVNTVNIEYTARMHIECIAHL